MLHWALMVLCGALVAAIFGFGGIAPTIAGITQVLFVGTIIMFVVSFFAGVMRRNLSVKSEPTENPEASPHVVPSSCRRGRRRTRRSLHHH